MYVDKCQSGHYKPTGKSRTARFWTSRSVTASRDRLLGVGGGPFADELAAQWLHRQPSVRADGALGRRRFLERLHVLAGAVALSDLIWAAERRRCPQRVVCASRCGVRRGHALDYVLDLISR